MFLMAPHIKKSKTEIKEVASSDPGFKKNFILSNFALLSCYEGALPLVETIQSFYRHQNMRICWSYDATSYINLNSNLSFCFSTYWGFSCSHQLPEFVTPIISMDKIRSFLTLTTCLVKTNGFRSTDDNTFVSATSLNLFYLKWFTEAVVPKLSYNL